MKKNILSSVFQCNSYTPFYVDFRRFTSLEKGQKWPPLPPPRLPVVVVVVAVAQVALAQVAKHRRELPPQTSTDWQNPAPPRLSQLLALRGKEAGSS